jgi:hypothetical protein
MLDKVIGKTVKKIYDHGVAIVIVFTDDTKMCVTVNFDFLQTQYPSDVELYDSMNTMIYE